MWRDYTGGKMEAIETVTLDPEIIYCSDQYRIRNDAWWRIENLAQP
jgi:hypothetical protein